MDTQHIQSVLEVALLTAQSPLSWQTLNRLFDNAFDKKNIEEQLKLLQTTWQIRCLELVEVAQGWRFQTKPQYTVYLDKLTPEKAPKYSRAVLETLTIIAYKQPVTRGDIETIRGVSVASETIKRLEERGWIEIVGHKEVVGRPALWATTPHFLSDLGLKRLSDLPPLPITHR